MLMRSSALGLIGAAVLGVCAASSLDWQAAGNAWWKNVEYLAGDALEGRNVGSPGFDKAADYVAAEFRKAELKPGNGESYFQPVEFVETSIDPAHSPLALMRQGRQIPIAVPGEAYLGYGRDTAPAIEAPLVFAGYGLVIPEAHYDDLKDLPVKGAVVISLSGGPASIDGNLRSHYSSGEERRKFFRAASAVGSIGISNPKTMEIPWRRQILAWGMPDMELADASVTGGAGLKFGARWDPAKADDLLAGSGHTFAEIVAAANEKRPLPHFALPTKVSAQVRATTKPVASKNVIGFRPGDDATLKDEIVVISAHLDHLGVGKPIGGDGIYNGAMDDASGIASLIEIAKSLRASGVNAKRSIAFVAVTGEEKGELGSAFFAAHPTLRGRMVADLNMDMYLPLFPLKWLEVQGLNESTLGADIRAAASAAGVKVQADKEPDHNRFIRSDQYSFIKKGVPSLAFKFGYLPGDPEEKIFKGWYTNRYHGVKDDLTQPKDLVGAARFNDILKNLALRVANADRRPEWGERSFFRRFASTGQ